MRRYKILWIIATGLKYDNIGRIINSKYRSVIIQEIVNSVHVDS